MLTLSDFDFELPPERIAQAPAAPRDNARLLHVHDDGRADRHIRDLPDLLRSGDLLVTNDTRVIPARLFGLRGAVKVEILLHRALGQNLRECFARPGKRLSPGDTIVFAPDFSAILREKHDDGLVVLDFGCGDAALHELLARYGIMPLPPYIKRDDSGRDADRQDYQTVFAARDGAVAAPTAGLHFTPELLTKLQDKYIRRVSVTLHVGAGTFLPVKTENISDHKMHREWGAISAETADTVNRTRAAGGRIVAVGTTSLRVLESALRPDGTVAPFAAETGIFLYPGKQIRGADLLLTNFHLPKSTLFMLACAFAGTERMHAAYRHAIAADYRFYSYGDACLLEKPA